MPASKEGNFSLKYAYSPRTPRICAGCNDFV